MLSAAFTHGQGVVGSVDLNESPLERAKRAREELTLRLEQEAEYETLEDRIIRLKRELAEAQAALADRDAPVLESAAVEVSTDALVVISSGKSEGSGFIAEMKGRTFLITNIHVLGAARNASIQNLDGVTVDLPSRVYVSRSRDIAIVPIDWQGAALQLSQSLSFDEISIGQPITVMGNADGAREVSRLKGIVAGIGPDELQVTAKFVAGHSGSPIVHDNLGKVIAIASHLKDFSAKTGWTQGTGNVEVRRFGYRLDGEIQWSLLSFEDLYRQAELYHRYEDRTRVMSRISYMLHYEDQLMLDYRSHESLGYLFEYFDRDFQWHRGMNSSHNQRMLKRFVMGMMSELQTDRQSTEEALTVEFYQRQFASIEGARDQALKDFIRFRDSRLD
jgi:hypothetical protein